MPSTPAWLNSDDDGSARATEVQIPRQQIAQLADYCVNNVNLAVKRELLEALKKEAKNILKVAEEKEERGGRRVGGNGRGGDGERWVNKFDTTRMAA